MNKDPRSTASALRKALYDWLRFGLNRARFTSGARSWASALLDHSVYRNTVTMAYATQKQTVEWGNQTHTLEVTGFCRKQLPPTSEQWKREQIEALPSIFALARQGQLRCCDYMELKFEDWRGVERGARGVTGDLLHGIEVKRIPAAVERSNMQQHIDIKIHASQERLTSFCKFLLGLEPSLLETHSDLWSGFTAFEQRNLRALERFRELCSGISEKHYPDVFHLWTAETNGLDYFLTMDGKFIKVMTLTKRVQLPTQPITPRDLVTEMGITKLEPMPVEDFGFHKFFDLVR